jgi:hypothetical protein
LHSLLISSSLLQGLNTVKPPVRRGSVMLPFIADEDNTILRHLKGGQFFNPLSQGFRKLSPFFPLSLAGRLSMVLQFSWYRKVGPPVEEITDTTTRINAEMVGDVDEIIQWPIGSLYGQQHVRKTVYTVSIYIRLN